MNDILKNISLILEADRLGIQASEIKKLLENIEKYALKRTIQELDNIVKNEDWEHADHAINPYYHAINDICNRANELKKQINNE
tara:strand:- start:852 stop:1103 length:252 start_codon:yes stop_codon:yes gene_type:complete